MTPHSPDRDRAGHDGGHDTGRAPEPSAATPPAEYPGPATPAGTQGSETQDGETQDGGTQDGGTQDAGTQDAGGRQGGGSEVRDIAEVPAVEVITTAAVHLMSAAAVKCGLAEEDADDRRHLDLAEARVLIGALAGLVTAAAPDIGNQHARALRDGLRSLQLAFREASAVPDAPGDGPGERLTGRVR